MLKIFIHYLCPHLTMKSFARIENLSFPNFFIQSTIHIFKKLH